MTKQSFNMKLSAPETVKGALLLGIVVGGLHRDNPVGPCCDDCQAHLDQLRDMFTNGPSPEAQAQMEAQLEAAQQPAPAPSESESTENING